MNPLGFDHFGALFGVVGALAAIAFAADTQPSPPEPVEVRYSPPSHPALLATTFVDWDSLVPRYTPVGRSMSVFDNPTPALDKFEVHITTLRPGMFSHAVHHHAWEEMLLIKEGSVEVSINGKKHPAGPGFLIFFASHDPHNLKNVGATDATYYVINFVTDLVHAAADRPAVEQAVPGKLGSSVIDCDGITPTSTPTGSRVAVVDSPTLTFQRLVVHITTLNPGQSTRSDMIDPGDELFIVRSGFLEATVNGVTSRMKEGSLFYCAPNDKRTFKNIGAVPASYQVFKVVSDKSPQSRQ
jgi:XRE family transcriptional regulator, regulator of sulfur utilization